MPGGEPVLQALYSRVHGLYKAAAGSADEVVVVGTGAGLITGHAVRGDELGRLAAAAEEFESTVNRGYAYAREALPGLPVYFFSAQVAGPVGEDLEYRLPAPAVADAPANTGLKVLERFLRHMITTIIIP